MPTCYAIEPFGPREWQRRSVSQKYHRNRCDHDEMLVLWQDLEDESVEDTLPSHAAHDITRHREKDARGLMNHME